MANYKKWTEEELKFLNDNISILRDEELASKLSQITGQNITYGMVRRQRRKLGIVKKRGRPAKNKKNVPVPTVDQTHIE
jgi:hypothetical protein